MNLAFYDGDVLTQALISAIRDRNLKPLRLIPARVCLVSGNTGQSAQTAHPDGLIGRIRPAALPRIRRVVRLSGSSASC